MNNKNKLAFGKMNYLLMIAGLCVIALGYIIMSMDQEEFGFGVLGITVGPIVLTLGFIIQFFAIFYKPKQS
jgi:hypothetical protein